MNDLIKQYTNSLQFQPLNVQQQQQDNSNLSAGSGEREEEVGRVWCRV